MGTSCTYMHKYHIHMCAYHVLLIQPLSSDTARSLKTSLETSSDNTDASCLAVPCNDTSIGYNIFFIISSTSISRHYSFPSLLQNLYVTMVNRLTTSQSPILKRDLHKNSFLTKAEIKDQTHLIISYFSNGLEKMLFIDHL